MTNRKQVQTLGVNIGGKIYQVTSDDEYLNAISRGFEPPMVELFKTLAADSQTILDVGANIGCTALLFSELAPAVYAFEPSPTTYSFLSKNIKQNGKSNIFSQNIGLGSESASKTLTFAPADRSGGFVSDQIETNDSYTTEEIQIGTLDHFAQQENLSEISFIKIDVEGFEAEVIKGGLETLKAHRPIVVLELNHFCLNAFQRTSVPDFFDFLRSVFPLLYALDGSYYLDLHQEHESYSVMYHHIVEGHFNNIVAGFDDAQLARFKSAYNHGFSKELNNSLRHRLVTAAHILLGR